MSNFLKELDAIGNSLTINFLKRRIESKNIRGHHFLQHTRPCVSWIYDVLKIIKSINNGTLIIPKGDEYNPRKNINGFKLGEYHDYNFLIQEIKKLDYSYKSSPMSLKKNDFNNFDVLGLISRFKIKDNRKEYCDGSETRCYYDKIEISKRGIQFLELNSETARRDLIASNFKRYLGSHYDDLLKILISCNGKITMIEYVLFASYIDFDDEIKFNVEDCIDTINDYRSLSRAQKNQIENFFHENSNPSKSKTDKNSWDWGNWKNAAQTLFTLLSDSKLIHKTKEGNLVLNVELRNNKPKFKRLQEIIYAYNELHELQQVESTKTGFEHHHVIPFSWIENIDEYSYIEDHMNLLYISGTKHNQIPKINNSFIELYFQDNAFILKNKNGNEIKLKLGEDVYFKNDYKEDYVDYNVSTRKKFNY